METIKIHQRSKQAPYFTRKELETIKVTHIHILLTNPHLPLIC